GIAAVGIARVALHLQAIGVYEGAVVAERELAGARVEVATDAVDVAIDDEEPVARERDVGRLARVDERALGEDLLGARELHAGAGLRASDRRAEYVGEHCARLLEADGVRVCDVVADDAESAALCGEA